MINRQRITVGHIHRDKQTHTHTQLEVYCKLKEY